MGSRFQTLANLTLPPTATVRDALQAIDQNSTGIVLVVDEHQRILDSMTDGDLRRAILGGRTLDCGLAELMDRPERQQRPRPITVTPETSPADVLSLMKRYAVQQVPVVDQQGTVLGMHTMRALVPDLDDGLEAVVMAGGFGSRLRPLTEDTPKPMLKVGDRPLLEHIIKGLRTSGIADVRVTTHYRPEVIHGHFGDGSEFGVNMDYVHEVEPLGTAGALRLLERPERTMLVMNGDILTNVDYRRMKAYHEECRALMTVAVRAHETYIPYGVIQERDGIVVGINEKPTIVHFVNAGIYMLDPRAFEYLGDNGRMDMTDLIVRLMDEGQTVASFPVTEYWLDIGHHDDYMRAQVDIQQGRV